MSIYGATQSDPYGRKSEQIRQQLAVVSANAINVHFRQPCFQVLKLFKENLLESSDVHFAFDDNICNPIFAIRPSIDSVAGIVVANVPRHYIQRFGHSLLPHGSQKHKSEKEGLIKLIP